MTNKGDDTYLPHLFFLSGRNATVGEFLHASFRFHDAIILKGSGALTRACHTANNKTINKND